MEKPKVKLVGEDGNAFVILGRVSKALRKAGMETEAALFLLKAVEGDYDHLLRTAMKYIEVEGMPSSDISVLSALMDVAIKTHVAGIINSQQM